MTHATSLPLRAARWLRRNLPQGTPPGKSDQFAPSRPAALLAVALFTFQLSRFYMAFDVMLYCPHHAGMNMDMGQGMAMEMASSTHADHQMAMSHEPTKPAPGSPVCRCCCRFSWDGLMTIVTLDVPSDAVQAPPFEGARSVAVADKLSHPENDLSPPFEPPRA